MTTLLESMTEARGIVVVDCADECVAFEREATKIMTMVRSSSSSAEHGGERDVLDGRELLVGLFIGGSGSRMGFVPKGLLNATNLSEAAAADGSNQSIIRRLHTICVKTWPCASIALIDRPNGEAFRAQLRTEHPSPIHHGLADGGYGSLGLPILVDEPTGIGPLGGLLSLCREAQRQGRPWVVALACDMPFVSVDFLRALGEVPSGSSAHAPSRDGHYEPLAAIYRAERVLALAPRLLDEGRHSLQALLRALAATELRHDRYNAQALVDWDSPDDLPDDTKSA